MEESSVSRGRILVFGRNCHGEGEMFYFQRNRTLDWIFAKLLSIEPVQQSPTWRSFNPSFSATCCCRDLSFLNFVQNLQPVAFRLVSSQICPCFSKAASVSQGLSTSLDQGTGAVGREQDGYMRKRLVRTTETGKRTDCCPELAAHDSSVYPTVLASSVYPTVLASAVGCTK